MSNNYSVSITLTSGIEEDSRVNVTTEWSHDLVDHLANGGSLPPSYLAGRDTVTFLQLARYKESFNYTDEELAAMTTAEQDAAILEAAANAIHTIKVDRIP